MAAFFDNARVRDVVAVEQHHVVALHMRRRTNYLQGKNYSQGELFAFSGAAPHSSPADAQEEKLFSR